MRLGYLLFLLTLVLVGTGGWFLSSRFATPAPAPVITTSTTATSTPSEPAPGPAPTPAATSASLTQTIVVNGIGITPLVVLEDSRCPVDVQCIQAGTVRLQTKLETEGKVQTQVLTLGKPFSFGGSIVTLTKVTPVKQSKVSINPLDYFFEFSVISATASGTLSGTMTLGPVCPVEQVDNPCTPTPEMFAARKVNVYTLSRTRLVTTLTPDASGSFTASLPPGSYYVAMAQSSGVGHATGVPTTITIRSGATTGLHIDVDTGIR